MLDETTVLTIVAVLVPAVEVLGAGEGGQHED